MFCSLSPRLPLTSWYWFLQGTTSLGNGCFIRYVCYTARVARINWRGLTSETWVLQQKTTVVCGCSLRCGMPMRIQLCSFLAAHAPHQSTNAHQCPSISPRATSCVRTAMPIASENTFTACRRLSHTVPVLAAGEAFDAIAARLRRSFPRHRCPPQAKLSRPCPPQAKLSTPSLPAIG